MRRFALLSLLLIAAPGSVAQTAQICPCASAKTPYEAFNFSMDFSSVIPSTDIALDSVTAVNARTNTASSAIVAVSPVPAVFPGTSKVIFRLQGGNSGESYKVLVRVTDSVTGEKREGILMLSIS